MNEKLLVGIVFLITYAFLAISKRLRATAIWLAIGVLWLATVFVEGFQIVSLGKIVCDDIHWNVIGIFAGTLILAELFVESRVPVLLADLLIGRSKTAGWAILWVCVLASAISAFVENVATVLIVAPVAIAVARRMDVSPVPFLIGIAISSNLQGTATLIGDPPSMILATHEKMNFNDFFFFRGRPGIFFAVQAGAVASFAVLYLFFRKYRQPVVEIEVVKPRSWVPTGLLVAMVVSLACASFVDPDFRWFAGTACMGFAAAGLLWAWRVWPAEAKDTCLKYDWSTTTFLAGVFVLVAALDQVGIIDDIAVAVGKAVGDSRLAAYACIVGFSVALSAFIDNVPYITAMLPVVMKLSMIMGMDNDYLLAFGLLMGACLGGNITPIGASANIVSIGLLRREGYHVNIVEFARIGLPFTLAATIVGAGFIWIFWA